MADNINYQFKLLYAIGICFIIAGHISFNGGISIFYDWFPLYNFHLGLFCFASGYLYSGKDSIGVYIVKKFKKLIIPLYTWNLIYCILVYLSMDWGFTIGTSTSVSIVDKLLIMPLIDGHQFGYNLATWFIFPFFCVEIFNVLARAIIKGKYQDEIIFLISFIIGLIAVKYANQLEVKKDLLLWFIRFGYFLPFFCFGILYKSTLESKDKLSNLYYFGVILLISLVLMIKYGTLVKGLVPSWGNFNINPLTVYVVGGLGIAFWLRITRILTPVLGQNKTVNLIANNTFYIMIHHILGFMILKTIYFILAKYIHLDPVFNVEQFHTNLWYYYNIDGLSQFSILYVLFGLIVPIIIRKIVPKNMWLG